MYALQVALALAVSMLIFSTFCTMVVEIIYKLFHLRQRGLTKMLESFYEGEVKQRCRKLLAREGGTVEEMPEFVAKVTAMTGGASTLSTIEFIRRLADTEIGKRLARRADREVEILIDDVVERYEDYGRSASHLFRRHSQISNAAVAVIVALCLNINAVTIFRTFQNNRELTQKIAGQAEQAVAAWEIQVELKKTAPADDASKTAADSDTKDIQGSLKELKDAFEKAQQLGLPIGWTGDTFFNIDDIKKMGWFAWIITTVLTGFLIGLGGPFWYDMVKRLTVVSQVTGALIRQPPAKDESGDGAKPPKGAAAKIPEDPIAAFKTAIKAQQIIDRAGDEATDFLGPRALRI